MQVELGPIINPLLELASTVVLAAGTWAVQRIIIWVGLKNKTQWTAIFDDALTKSVTYGLQQTQDMIRAKGWDHPDVKEHTLARAAPYMINRFPDVLKAAGFDMSDSGSVEAAVTGALDRAFPHAVAVAAASPGTPPATAPQPQTTAELPNQPGFRVVENIAA